MGLAKGPSCPVAETVPEPRALDSQHSGVSTVPPASQEGRWDPGMGTAGSLPPLTSDRVLCMQTHTGNLGLLRLSL